MKDDREWVLGAVKKALAPLKEAKKQTPYPDWDDELVLSEATQQGDTLWERFARQMAKVNGIPLQGLAAVAQHLHREGQRVGYCDPALLPVVQAEPTFEGIELLTTFERERLDDYLFGITRAAGAIAESGTVILKDATTASRLGALAPWTHIALLEPALLHPDIPTAIAHLGDDPAVVWATGPSKTADVEGILIEGVHGPGCQICCLLDQTLPPT